MTTPSNDYKRQTAERVTKAFVWVAVAALCLVFVAFVLGLVIPIWFAGAEKLLAARLTCSTAAMLIGGFEIVLGILLALVGLTVDYDIDASAGPTRVKLASASPGLLLIVCGNLLIGFSLVRGFQYQYSEMEFQGPQTQKVQQVTEQGLSHDTPGMNSPDVQPLPAGGPQ